jgi:hypothetical protein
MGHADVRIRVREKIMSVRSTRGKDKSAFGVILSSYARPVFQGKELQGVSETR